MNWDQRMAAAYDETPEEGTIPEPESDERPVDGTPIESLDIVVIGSADWPNPIVVQAVLLGWAQHHPGASVTLWTTDAPDGAEHEAREHAHRLGWRYATAQLEQLLDAIHPVATFAFVVDGSDAEEFAREIGRRRPVQIYTALTLRPSNRWSKW